MTIQLLNCASMSPHWPRWHVAGLCLLVDTQQGPVLVDTGLGLRDHESPSWARRIFRFTFGIHYAPEECALRQVQRRGIQPQEIHHIVMTHLHFDHAGGLPDFPWASVHAHRREYEAMRHPRQWIERGGYNRENFEHGPHWVLYETITDQWLGWDAIRLPFEPRMFLIPLFGHTSGHCGVAIEDGSGWLLQAGDSMPLNTQFDLTPAWLNRMVLGPHSPRLRTFMVEHPEVRVLAGHTWRSDFDEVK